MDGEEGEGEGGAPPGSRVTVDLIGRQYAGGVEPGPTLMFLNLSYQQMAGNSSSPGGEGVDGDTPKVMKQVGRVEAITNEVCRLRFSQDILGHIFGVYSQEEEEEDVDADYGEDEEEGTGKKRKVDGSSHETPESKRKKVGSASKAKVHKGKKATSFVVNKTKGKSKGSKKSSSK